MRAEEKTNGRHEAEFWIEVERSAADEDGGLLVPGSLAYVVKQGWATMPGEKQADNKVADECVRLLMQMS